MSVIPDSIPRYRGVVVPMVSAFLENETVDIGAMKRIVDLLTDARHDGVFALGTTGESASIPTDEKRRLVEAIAMHAQKRAIVYAGIAGTCFRESVDLAKAFK